MNDLNKKLLVKREDILRFGVEADRIDPDVPVVGMGHFMGGYDRKNPDNFYNALIDLSSLPDFNKAGDCGAMLVVPYGDIQKLISDKKAEKFPAETATSDVSVTGKERFEIFEFDSGMALDNGEPDEATVGVGIWDNLTDSPYREDNMMVSVCVDELGENGKPLGVDGARLKMESILNDVRKKYGILSLMNSAKADTVGRDLADSAQTYVIKINDMANDPSCKFMVVDTATNTVLSYGGEDRAGFATIEEARTFAHEMILGEGSYLKAQNLIELGATLPEHICIPVLVPPELINPADLLNEALFTIESVKADTDTFLASKVSTPENSLNRDSFSGRLLSSR
ncbi:MAG: hypothetical protein FWC20_04455 [Oscillospiraceae bacterium]|nr:hypothetical protein [Oscillospiraceae bacterium]MCL2278644.1 hypothetical protein [Oscillospiraceae bacterium]